MQLRERVFRIPAGTGFHHSTCTLSRSLCFGLARRRAPPSQVDTLPSRPATAHNSRNLVANATVTNRGGLPVSIRRSFRAIERRFPPDVTRLMTDVAPSTSSVRRVRSPAFVILPFRSFPPEEFDLGVSPNQAAKERPDGKASGFATVAARAVAMIRPIPGIVASLRLASLVRCQSLSCFSSCLTSSVTFMICRA